MTAERTPKIGKLRDKILAEREKGNIVFWGVPGELHTAKLDDFVTQPAEGILYDLNRLEEICMTFLDDPKWVNDFAIALTIRKLKDELSAATDRLEKRNDFTAEHIEQDATEEAAQGGVWVPREIDRAKHGHVLLVWNDCMIKHETLEMTWPKLVEAMLAARPGREEGR